MGLMQSEFWVQNESNFQYLKNCWASSASFKAEFAPLACWSFILATLKSEWRQGLSLTDEGENWHHMGKHHL